MWGERRREGKVKEREGLREESVRQGNRVSWGGEEEEIREREREGKVEEGEREGEREMR